MNELTGSDSAVAPALPTPDIRFAVQSLIFRPPEIVTAIRERRRFEGERWR